MTHSTKGIVLRCIRYGETSLICSVYTELFGLQSYLIKGVRSSKARHQKAALLFPMSILELEVYHHPQKNLQFVREYRPEYIYKNLQDDVVKNSVAIFAAEVSQQLVADQDPDQYFFNFLNYFLIQLDEAVKGSFANYPLYFLIHAARIAGFRLSGSYSEQTPYVAIADGKFSAEAAALPTLIDDYEIRLMDALNTENDLKKIEDIRMTAQQRNHLLNFFISFLQWHVPHFTALKSTAVLQAILH